MMGRRGSLSRIVGSRAGRREGAIMDVDDGAPCEDTAPMACRGGAGTLSARAAPSPVVAGLRALPTASVVAIPSTPTARLP